MNAELGLRILGQIMGWKDDEARDEFRWLSFMSAYKYDGYHDYLAGARFLEKFAMWLQQFDKGDRAVAYEFIKTKLIYFSSAELHRLVEKFFPECVQSDLVRHVSESLSMPSYRVWSTDNSIKEYRYERRRTLFMGLSDGARIDALRRANVGVISNEQVVVTTQIDHQKWSGLLDDLSSDLKAIKDTVGDVQFARVYLIDDFTASGTSLLRPNDKGGFTGKLVKFAKSYKKAKEDLGGNSPFVDDFRITVHHYIGTEQARKNIIDNYTKASSELQALGLKDVKFRFGMLLPGNVRITAESNHPFVDLCEKYYNSCIEGGGFHASQSGMKSKKYGYAGCGLPVVLEHNTPNNSLPLLWAETGNDKGEHSMKALFRRRERHSDMDEVEL